MKRSSDLPWQELVKLVLQEYQKQLVFKYWEKSICQGNHFQFDVVEQAFVEQNYSIEQLPYEQRFSLHVVGEGLNQIWQETQSNRDYLLETLIRYCEANLAFESCFQELFV